MITHNATNAQAVSTSDPVTQSITCDSSVRLLVVMITVGGATTRTGGTPTYNGTALTQASTTTYYATSPETNIEMWYLINPSIGTYDVSIPNNGSLEVSLITSRFSPDLGASVAVIDAQSNTGVSTAPGSATHSDYHYDDLMVAMFASGSDSTATYCTGTQLVNQQDCGTYIAGAAYRQFSFMTIPTAYSISWGNLTSEDWAVVSAVFREVVDSSNVEVAKVIGHVVIEPYGLQVSKVVGYVVLKDWVPASGIQFFLII